MKKALIIHVPVIHRGFLDFIKKERENVSTVYIIDDLFLGKLTEFKPDIASISAVEARDILLKFGFNDISILSEDQAGQLKDSELILIQDEISRNLADKYLKDKKIEWRSVFLHWDRGKVLAQQNLEDIPVSKNDFDLEMMAEASVESKKSGDWWRQIGAVLVKDREIILRANNKDLPGDHTPYQVGEVRDLFNPGERQDLANTIHAEQSIISQAAKNGISVAGLSLYVSTFPCPVCAKLIACSGIKEVYFGEGGSNFDAKKVLDSAGVKIVYAPFKS